MRDIVGTQAVGNIEEAKSQLYALMKVRIVIIELITKEGRVVIIEMPKHPIGQSYKFYEVSLYACGGFKVEMHHLSKKDHPLRWG